MKTETSAGGLIVCSIRSKWYVLILRDMNETWTFPKGLIEKGEKPEDAALREIKEEVEIAGLKLLAALPPIQYFYERSGTIKKTVHYFVFQSQRRVRPHAQKEEGIREAKWVSIDRAINMIGYHQTNVALLEETWKLVKPQTYNG